MPEVAKQLSTKQLPVDKWQLLLEMITPAPPLHVLEHHWTQPADVTVEFSKLGLFNSSTLVAPMSTTDTESR